MNLLEKVHVDSAQTFLSHALFSLPSSQLEGFVRADMKKWSRKNRSHLREPLPDQLLRPGLARSQHGTMRRLRQLGIRVVHQNAMQVSKSLLLGNDGDVIPARVAHPFFLIGAGSCSAGKRGKCIGRERKGVLEIRRVDIHFVLGKYADLMLLELQRGNGTAREIVAQAAILHSRPVAR